MNFIVWLSEPEVEDKNSRRKINDKLSRSNDEIVPMLNLNKSELSDDDDVVYESPIR